MSIVHFSFSEERVQRLTLLGRRLGVWKTIHCVIVVLGEEKKDWGDIMGRGEMVVGMVKERKEVERIVRERNKEHQEEVEKQVEKYTAKGVELSNCFGWR